MKPTSAVLFAALAALLPQVHCGDGPYYGCVDTQDCPADYNCPGGAIGASLRCCVQISTANHPTNNDPNEGCQQPWFQPRFFDKWLPRPDKQPGLWSCRDGGAYACMGPLIVA